MVEPTVVSTQASSSPSYGPNIAPARMFCGMTNITRCCLCTTEVWYAALINGQIGAVICGGAKSMTEKQGKKLLPRSKIGIPLLFDL